MEENKEMTMTIGGKRNVSFDNVPGEMFKWKQFGGGPKERYFTLEIPEAFAKELAEFGWRIKKRGFNPNTNGYDTTDDLDAPFENAYYQMKAYISYESLYSQPEVWRIIEDEKAMTKLQYGTDDDRDVKILDRDIIISADIDLNGYVGKKSRDGLMTPYVENITVRVKRPTNSAQRWNEKYKDFEKYE